MVEYLIVIAFVAIAIAGAVALFGDEIRAALGSAPAPVHRP
jgi:Flp pilus assembly pilin Flp